MMEQPLDVEAVSLQHSQHALNNALVLQKIFGHLADSGSFEDLKNARLVSNAPIWQEEMRKVWRRETVLVLQDGPVLAAPYSYRGTTLTNFLLQVINPDSPYQLTELPYERIKLRNLDMDVNRLEMESPAKTFWDAVGTSVKHLTLDNIKFYCNYKDIKRTDVSRFLGSTLPNLESLRLEQIQDMWIMSNHGGLTDPEENVVLPNISKLHVHSGGVVGLQFAQLPNLKEIKLSEMVRLERFFDALPEKTSVKVLDLMDCESYLYDDDEDVGLLLFEAEFSSLEHITVKLPREGLSTSLVLPNLTHTLRKLELFRWIGDFSPYSYIDEEFPVLAELRLWGNVEGDLTFLINTPNLQLLHMDLLGFEKQREMKYELGRCGHDLDLLTCNRLVGAAREGRLIALHKLEYCQINWDLDCGDVATLAEWMPNLKTLKLVLDSDAFQEVCHRWKNLEHFECLYGSSITDKDIAHGNRLSAVDGTLRFGLTALKELKSFVYIPDCYSITLTDECVEEGFLQLPQLSKLEIAVSNKFSEKSENILRERIPDVKINGDHNPFWNLDCCRNSAYRRYILEFSPFETVDDDEWTSEEDDAVYDEEEFYSSATD